MTKAISTIEFKDIVIVDHEICEVLSKFVMQFKVMILNCVKIDVEIFTKLISMFQLNKLVVNKSKVSSNEDSPTLSDAAGYNVEKDGRVMQLIAVSESDDLLINVLVMLKLQSTKIAFAIADKFNSTFAEFMKQQKCLKQVVLKSPATRSVLGPVIELLKQNQLYALAIALNHGSYKPHEYDGLAELITSQTAIKELEIRSNTISQDSIYAIHQSLSLRKLKLDIEKFPKHIEFPNPCRPHDNLKTLIIDNLSSEQSLDAMLRMFAKVEKFCVNRSKLTRSAIYSWTVVTNVQNRLKSLKYLKVEHLTEYFPCLKMPSLRKFQVDSVMSSETLQSFLYENPQLQEVELSYVKKNSKDKRHIFDFPGEHGELVNMQRLTIEGFSKVTEINENVFRSLKRTFPSLTNLAVGDSIRVNVDEKIADYLGIQLTRFTSFGGIYQNTVFNNFTWSLFYSDVVMSRICWEEGGSDVSGDDDESISDFDGWD